MEIKTNNLQTDGKKSSAMTRRLVQQSHYCHSWIGEMNTDTLDSYLHPKNKEPLPDVVFETLACIALYGHEQYREKAKIFYQCLINHCPRLNPKS